MAASTAAVSFPTFKLPHTTLRCDGPASKSNQTLLVRLPYPSPSTITSSSSCGGQRLPILKVLPDLAQEEAAVDATTTAASAAEEGVTGEEVTEDADGDADADADADAEASAINTKLYFGNLPYSVDSATLAGIIQDYASPELVEVLYNIETGKSRGFAFVTMSNIEDCNAVIENLDGSEYLGRTLRVNFSDKPKPKQPLYPETEHKLFIGNLSWSVTSESLAQAFQEYGNVVGARVLYDGETGKSRGYGFVCFSSKAEMEAALQSLNGKELEGRMMRVSLAQGKKY